MKETLTKRQEEVLAKIGQSIRDFGYPPTRAELAKALGFSVNAAEEHLKTLARKGHIVMVPSVSRGIRLVA